MNVAAGTRLGPYEIIAPIGAGGMGEVWRAKDTRLDRSVAIKLLPREFASNAQLKLRFEREAKTISQLNHPNICTLHDVGEVDGTNFLVMELLEGESLADRLSHGPLPLHLALKHAIEIASALDRAHRAGIVHRDLKPGNVVLTRSGAKLLDFGLAKPSASALENPPDAATQHRSLTEEGTIVGTYQYMAPEQVTGEPLDARADIFAFGAVLYEMLTGVPAFRGKNRTSIVAAIISGEPAAIASLQPLTPPALERVVQTCLAKDPEDRWQTAHDVMLQLKWIQEGGSQAGVAAPLMHRRRTRERAALAAAIFGTAYVTQRMTQRPVLQTSILPPENLLDAVGEGSGSLTISPDGTMVTFRAHTNGDKPTLWLRRLDSATAAPIAGTEGAAFPFWSPDSRFIAFFADTKLKKVDLSGSPPLALCDVQNNPRPGSWNQDGVIVFAPLSVGALAKVSAGGGTVTPVTKLDAGETTHRWSSFLPDGKHFLYMVGTHGQGVKSSANAIYAGSLDSTERRLIIHARSNAVYAAGHLLYVQDHVLMAQPFDTKKLTVTGDPVAIAQNVRYDVSFFHGVFSVSDAGSLVYEADTGHGSAVIHLLDRSGKDLRTIGDPGEIDAVAIAPDGKRLAISVRDPSTGSLAIWVQDLGRNVRTRFTFGDNSQSDPLWSPDSSKIVYSAAVKAKSDLFIKDANGSSAEHVLFSDNAVKTASGFTSDGKQVLFTSNDFGAKTRPDLWIVNVDAAVRIRCSERLSTSTTRASRPTAAG